MAAGGQPEEQWLLGSEQLEAVERRPGLTRGAIVAAALLIVDDEGLEALTMRRLGSELGVRAMAMYRHVRDKSQLLDLVIEGVLRDIEPPVLSGEWREDAARIARATRAGMLRHRHAIGLLASRSWVGSAGLAGIDQTLGVFRQAGLGDRVAIHAQFALGNYVTGFCAWEAANLGTQDHPEARKRALEAYGQFLASLPAQRFPNLHDLAGELVGGSLDERFEAGLSFLLAGVEDVARTASD